MNQPRKLLVVHKADGRFDVMLEIGGRTMSKQVDERLGEKVMDAAQDAILGVLVQSGFVLAQIATDAENVILDITGKANGGKLPSERAMRLSATSARR
jgi:hypothetical protein